MYPVSRLLVLALFTLLIPESEQLQCYECSSKNHSSCGPYFESSAFKSKKCSLNETVCALQRQPRKTGQLVGIIRSCYTPGLLPGLNSSEGCRHWTNSQNYRALYCFCASDMCNIGDFLRVSLLLIFCLFLFAVE